MKKITIVIAAVAGSAATAILLASCGTGKANEAVANAPRPTVTVTAPAKPAPTVTTTITVPTVPQVCLDALDNADTGFGYAGAAMQASSDGFKAASQLDVPGIEAATRDMNAATAKLNGLSPTYNANKAACRAAVSN